MYRRRGKQQRDIKAPSGVELSYLGYSPNNEKKADVSLSL